MCVIDSLFGARIINGDNEHLGSCNSARELREGHEGVRCLIGNSGVNSLALSLHSPKVQLLISQTPADPGTGNSLGMLRTFIFK